MVQFAIWAPPPANISGRPGTASGAPGGPLVRAQLTKQHQARRTRFNPRAGIYIIRRGIKLIPSLGSLSAPVLVAALIF